MKKAGLLLAFLLGTTLSAQELRHEAGAINIEVPVRVYQGDAFVEDLTLEDFEVTEDGKPQKVEAVYLVKKAAIERRQETQPFQPATNRRFYLIFDLARYDARVADSIRFFMNSVIVPGDMLTIVTPLKAYNFKSETFQMLTREQAADQLVGILRKDIVLGNSGYQSALMDLADLNKEIHSVIVERPGGSGETLVDVLLAQYAALLEKIRNMRSVNQNKLLEFAKILQDTDGQKDVFLIYQRIFIPTIDRRILQAYAGRSMDEPGVIQTISDIFEFYRSEVKIDVNEVKKAYADSSITIHFLFLSTPQEDVAGLGMAEQGEGVFAPFLEMARATGGLAESSSNLEALMKNAARATETYYLLYYSPAGYKPDGKFKNIRVKVRGRDVRISHREGYIAD